MKFRIIIKGSWVLLLTPTVQIFSWIKRTLWSLSLKTLNHASIIQNIDHKLTKKSKFHSVATKIGHVASTIQLSPNQNPKQALSFHWNKLIFWKLLWLHQFKICTTSQNLALVRVGNKIYVPGIWKYLNTQNRLLNSLCFSI